MALAVLLIVIAADIGTSVYKSRTEIPDYQVAWVGNYSLPQDTVTALETQLAALGEDCNGDGRVIVRINSYVLNSEGDNAEYAAAGNVRLLGDLDDCDSYFFLFDPDVPLQQNYGILAREDGTLAEEGADDWFSISWGASPVLAGLSLGTYSDTILGETMSGDSQELLSGMSLARRGFVTGRTSANLAQCDALWKKIIYGGNGNEEKE